MDAGLVLRVVSGFRSGVNKEELLLHAALVKALTPTQVTSALKSLVKQKKIKKKGKTRAMVYTAK